MNTNVKLHAGLIGLAFAAALSLAVNPASAAVNYKFETVSSSSGATFSVRLVDAATGQSVTNAHVYVVHRQWLPMKSSLRFIDRRIELAPDGNGAFTYQSNDVQAGATIPLVAQVGDSADVWGSVRVGA
jgi:hypothetical protein